VLRSKSPVSDNQVPEGAEPKLGYQQARLAYRYEKIIGPAYKIGKATAMYEPVSQDQREVVSEYHRGTSHL